MYLAIGERVCATEKNFSAGSFKLGRVAGKSGSQLVRSTGGRDLDWVLVLVLLGVKVWRLEKRPPWTVGRF